MDLLDAGFAEIFEKAEPANPLKAEYLLPIYIDELMHAGKVSVKVLPTHDKWFGVTYAEDKQTVIDSFAKLVADGVYKKRPVQRFEEGKAKLRLGRLPLEGRKTPYAPSRCMGAV